MPVEAAQNVYRIVEEHAIQIREIDKLERQLDYTERESALKDQVIKLGEDKAQLYKTAYEMEVQLTDRALKLSEKKSFWKVIAEVGLVAIIITVIAAAF